MQSDPFVALADPSRRRILETLRTGERQVNDIVAALDIHQSGVSRHLRILLEAGFVRMRPHGQQRLYSLRPEPFQALQEWLGHYRAAWESRLERFAVAAEARSRATRSNRRKPGDR